MLLRYNGSAFVAEYTIALAAAGFAFDASKWHKIAVTPSSISGSSNVSVLCELTDSADTKRLAFRVTIANYGALIGSSGLFADKSYTSFNALTIE